MASPARHHRPPSQTVVDPSTDSVPIDAQVEVEVAHEALIRHWPRLRAWLDQDRAALLLRESVREAAQEWEQHDRDESYLAHRGRRLAEAEALTNHPRFTLNAQERAYLDAAVALREREAAGARGPPTTAELHAARQLAAEAEARREAESAPARREAEQRVAEQAVAAGKLRRRFVVAASLGAAAVIAALAALFFGLSAQDRERDAIRQAQIAREQTLLAQAQALLVAAPAEREAGRDELGALLARQAYLFAKAAGTSPSTSIVSAMRQSLATPYFGHALAAPSDGQVSIESVAFSPNGTWLATSGSEGAVLRNVTGPLPTPVVLPGPETQILSVAFSPDGQRLAAGGRFDGLWVWDTTEPAAEPIVLNGGAELSLSSVVFSGDLRWLAGTSDSGEVRLWDLADSAADPMVLDRLEERGSAVDFNPDPRVVFSPDGRFLAGGSPQRGALLWDLADPAAQPAVLAGPYAWNVSVAFSQDGTTLAVGNAHGAVLWNVRDRAAEPVVLPGPEIGILSVAFFSSTGRAWPEPA